MQISVAQLLKAPIGSIRNYEVNETIDFSGGNSPVQGEVNLTRTGQGILVKGKFHTEMGLTCSRCLQSYKRPLTLHIEEEYFPVTNVTSGAPMEVPDEPGCFTIDEHHLLDLTEAICQYGILAIPMKPLCREDCAGLCPTCGRDLNEGKCGCLQPGADQRADEMTVVRIHKQAERME